MTIERRVPERVFFILRLVAVLLCAAFMGATRGAAADARPIVGPGATKDAVIDAYGWPTGQSQLGTREILSYPQGQVFLENGKVERVDFSTNVPWPAPRPRPGAPSPTSVKKVEAPTDFWVTDFVAAQTEATRRRARILALFIGSDWSPPSKQFQDEVAFHPDFVNAFAGDFVFLRLDYPTRAPQPAELREQNTRLRTTYGVTTYPALLVLSPAGTLVGTVDLTKPQAGDSYRARTIAAVREVRDLLIAQPPPPDPTPAGGAAPANVADKPAVPDGRVGSLVTSAFSLVMLAFAGGFLLIAAGWWFLWRKPRTSVDERMLSATERISDAASGLPSALEIAEWTKEQLRAVVEGLAIREGYEVSARAGGGDGDLALTRPGESQPHVIVNCHPASAGEVSVKRVRELFGAITVEGVKSGWFVAPRGFSAEARAYADEHQILLIDAAHLLAQMRAVPAFQLRAILARAG